MKRNINLYVEGKGDISFIGQFITKHFSFKFNYDHLDEYYAESEEKTGVRIEIRAIDSSSSSGGLDATKVNALIKQIKTVNIRKGIESVILIDADTPVHTSPQGGCANRKRYLEEQIEGTDTKYFILPNGADDGNLETLLDKIIGATGKPFYSCLTSYINCMQGLPEANRPKTFPNGSELMKTKMDWFVYMMLGLSSRKKNSSKRNYTISDLWDLDSAALNPIKLFLKDVIG